MTREAIISMDIETFGLDNHLAGADHGGLRFAGSDERWAEFAKAFEAVDLPVERIADASPMKNDRVVLVVGAGSAAGLAMVRRMARTIDEAGLADHRLVIAVEGLARDTGMADLHPVGTIHASASDPHEEAMRSMQRLLQELPTKPKAIHDMVPEMPDMATFERRTLLPHRGYDHRTINSAPRSQRRR